jgi:hypothetical protein
VSQGNGDRSDPTQTLPQGGTAAGGTTAGAGAAGTGAVRPAVEGGTPVAFEDWGEAPLPESEVHDLFLSLDKATRARRLYQENNPVLQGFVATVKTSFARLWDRVPSLTVSVEEHAFRCFGKEQVSKEGREGLPFLFYRDGVRVLTFLPGFEEEVELFLHVIDRARQMGPRTSDDIVTLLWEEEFSAFQYSYVDMLAEGGAMPPAETAPPTSVERKRLERIVEGSEPEPVPPAVESGQPPVPQVVSTENFVETTYFLDQHDVERLYAAVDEEWKRDVRGAVLDALFDRLEDATYADRHNEVLRILGQLLPAFLARGDLTNVTKILIEVAAISDNPQLGAEERQEVEQLLKELSDPQVLSQFLGSLEDGSINPTDQEVSVFLSYLGADALPLLIRTVEKTESARLRERLAPALDGVAHKHARALAALVASPDEKVAQGSARIAGRIRLRAATNNLIALFRKSDVGSRRIAIDALAGMGDASTIEAMQEALADTDREVRISAARGLSNVRVPASREKLKGMVRSRALREADLTEQMAVFEAYGAVAVEEDIEILDKLLNGRRLLAKESPEIRACAAMALGRITLPAARTALLEASKDPHPMVRNAISKALSQARAG